MRYVAIGDSFTEGVGDAVDDGSLRGWADLVAEGLAAARPEPVAYANLAIRGRLLDAIVREQLPQALALDPAPTLITFNGGGNDMLRPGCDLAELLHLTESVIDDVQDAGIELVMLAGPNPAGRLPMGRTITQRGAQLTGEVDRLTAGRGVRFVDIWHDAEIRRAEYWAPDRLHLNAEGHRRVASLVLAGLGHGDTAHALDPADPERRRMWREARYYGRYVMPWIGRRLRGRSSGDGRTAKFPEWTPVPAP